MFQPVPFDAEWILSDKLDLKGIYRRPALDDLGQRKVSAEGVPLWDLTGPLPIRRHNDWTRKGFVFLTLASMGDLQDAAQSIRNRNLDPRDYVHVHGRERGPWIYALYADHQDVVDRQDFTELASLVDQFGVEAVLAIKRQEQPGFELPAALQASVSAPVGPRAVEAAPGPIEERSTRSVPGSASRRTRRGRPPRRPPPVSV